MMMIYGECVSPHSPSDVDPKIDDTFSYQVDEVWISWKQSHPRSPGKSGRGNKDKLSTELPCLSVKFGELSLPINMEDIIMSDADESNPVEGYYGLLSRLSNLNAAIVPMKGSTNRFIRLGVDKDYSSRWPKALTCCDPVGE